MHDFYSANIYFSYSPISSLPISDKISLSFPQHTLLGWVPVSSPYHSLLLGAFYPPNAFFLVTFKPASFISSHLAPVYERTLLLADWFAVLRALPSPSLPLPLPPPSCTSSSSDTVSHLEYEKCTFRKSFISGMPAGSGLMESMRSLRSW